MRTPIFSKVSNIVKAITNQISEPLPSPRMKPRVYNRGKPPPLVGVQTLALTKQTSKNCGSNTWVWRPPKLLPVLNWLFLKVKTVVSAFYNAMLVFQNGRAFINKLGRLRI